MTTIHDLTAHACSSAYATKQLSPVEVTRAALTRIEAWERKINAMYVVDAAGALAQATASEATETRGCERFRRGACPEPVFHSTNALCFAIRNRRFAR